MSITSQLYRAARLSATGRAIRTGHPARRVKNIAVGRVLFGRRGLIKGIWR